LAIAVEEGSETGNARRELAAADGARERAQVTAGDTHDADRSAPGGGRDRDDGFVVARQHRRIFNHARDAVVASRA